MQEVWGQNGIKQHHAMLYDQCMWGPRRTTRRKNVHYSGWERDESSGIGSLGTSLPLLTLGMDGPMGSPYPHFPTYICKSCEGQMQSSCQLALQIRGLTSSWRPVGYSHWNRKQTPCCNYPPISTVYPRNKLIAAVKHPSHQVQE